MNRDRCYFIPRVPRIVVRRTAAIGDVIAATCVADKISALGFGCVFEAAPMIRRLLLRSPNITALGDVIDTPDVNLDGCYENHPHRTRLHFSELFLDAANSQLRTRGISLGPPTNCRPELLVSLGERLPYIRQLQVHPKPWVFICPQSNSWVNRTIPAYVWTEVAKKIHGTCFWAGNMDAPPNFVNLRIRSLELLVLWLSCADLLVTVDTGPMHMAAALGVPIVALEQASSPDLHLSDQRDFITVKHPGLDCLNCQQNLCPKDRYIPPCQKWPPEVISDAVNLRLKTQNQAGVSAVIPIFKPDYQRLRNCLECVEPQVQEIIVTRDAGGVVPFELSHFSKVRHVQHRRPDLGFGKNVNFGVRHSNHRYILILNDDVFLRPDAVARLKECMKDGVGIVGHELWYANGTIQHGGKFRKPGMRGWGHIDHRRRVASIKQPMECENVTAASILVDRKAFYAAKGFDEDFFMYAEDDAFCLQMQQAGYKIIYTPHASGTHLESQSAMKRDKLHELIEPSNRIFDQKWGWWIDKNLHRVPGTFA